MKIKIKNDKAHLEDIYYAGLIKDFSKALEILIGSHRIVPKSSILRIKCSKDSIEIEYDDYSKFDLRNLLTQENRKLGGAGGRSLREDYKTKIKNICYIQLDNKRSKVIFKFNEILNNIIEIEKTYDISKYLKNSNELYTEILEIPREIYKMNTRETCEKGLYVITEFILNIAQHNFRKHNKYIIIEEE